MRQSVPNTVRFIQSISEQIEFVPNTEENYQIFKVFLSFSLATARKQMFCWRTLLIETSKSLLGVQNDGFEQWLWIRYGACQERLFLFIAFEFLSQRDKISFSERRSTLSVSLAWQTAETGPELIQDEWRTRTSKELEMLNVKTICDLWLFLVISICDYEWLE